MRNSRGAKKPKLTKRHLHDEQTDLARKIERKIADLKSSRITSMQFIQQTGSTFSEFFKRIENCFPEEMLTEAFPKAYPFEDLRTNFQDRLNELSGENRDGMVADEVFTASLVSITEEFLNQVTGAAQ